jgi:hypothetical protein
MKSKTLQNYSHRVFEEQISSKMDLSTDQPVSHPVARDDSVGLSGLPGTKWDFSRSVRKAPLFYILVGRGTIGGTALSLLSINPIKLLDFVAVINGVVADPMLIVVLIVSNSRRLLGDYVNGYTANFESARATIESRIDPIGCVRDAHILNSINDQP